MRNNEKKENDEDGGWHQLSENIWFVWSKTSYDGDKWRRHHDDDNQRN